MPKRIYKQEGDLVRRLPSKGHWRWEDFNNYQITQPGENSEDSLYRLICELYSFSGSDGKRHHEIQKARRARYSFLHGLLREQLASTFDNECQEQIAQVLVQLRKRARCGFVLSRPASRRWCITWRQHYEPMERLDDMLVQPNPGDRNLNKGHPDIWQHCPVCKGYGGWVLKDNCYPPYDTTQPPPAGWTWPNFIAFYGPCQHFRASCNQCNGWGWVEKTGSDATCIHDDVELTPAQATALNVPHFGMCWHVYRCRHCKRIKSEDSSG